MSESVSMRRRWWRLRTKPPPTSGAKVCTRPGHIVDTEANPAHVRHRGSPFTKVDARVSRGFGHGGAGAFLPVGPTPPCRTGPEVTKPWAKREAPAWWASPSTSTRELFWGYRTQRRRENHAAAIDGRILPLQAGEIMSRFEGSNWTHVEDLRTFVGHMPEQVRWQGRSTVVEALTQLGDMRGTSPKTSNVCLRWLA